MASDPKSPARPLKDTLPFITVMMPAFNEEAYIRESLISLISTGYPHDRMEIIVADGNSTDRTKEEVAKVSAEYSFVRYIINIKRQPANGCNLAAASADPRSEYYIRVDAHSKWSENFLPLCIQTAKDTEADLVVFVNAPVGITPFQKALAYALQHPLGVGNSLYRLGNYSGWVDHGQHGCFSQNIWRRVGGYNSNPEVYPNEDVDLSIRVVKSGGKIWLEQRLKMFYFPRKNIKELSIQYFAYGRSRLKTHLRNKAFPSLRQFIPPAFILIFLTSFIISLMGNSFFFKLTFCTYFLFISVFVLKPFLTKKRLYLLYLFYIFPAIHFFWSFGVFYEISKLGLKGFYRK